MIAAAALSVIFGAVLFSIPSEKLAWQGPLVMGTLAMPKPNPNPAKVYRVESREETDSLLSFMGFLSVIGILGLTGRKLLPTAPHAPKIRPSGPGSNIAAMAAAHPKWPFF
ncbi:MAG: hypothetical protein Kow00128_18190 [Deltaproteobacteria bacterium]